MSVEPRAQRHTEHMLLRGATHKRINRIGSLGRFQHFIGFARWHPSGSQRRSRGKRENDRRWRAWLGRRIRSGAESERRTAAAAARARGSARQTI